MVIDSVYLMVGEFLDFLKYGGFEDTRPQVCPYGHTTIWIAERNMPEPQGIYTHIWTK